MSEPLPQTRRGKILRALIEQLRTITTANGYVHNLAEVSTNIKNWHQKPEAETPVLYVVDDRTVYQYRVGKLSERSWFISIYGYMRDKTQEQMEELIADVEECLEKNKTLRIDQQTTINHFRITEVTTDNQLFSEIEGSQLFKIQVELLYTVCRDQIR